MLDQATVAKYQRWAQAVIDATPGGVLSLPAADIRELCGAWLARYGGVHDVDKYYLDTEEETPGGVKPNQDEG